MDSILFPHFYLSNENILRHQYLYTPNIIRLLSSDRPTRDSKGVKKWIADLHFPENRVVEDSPENGVQRFLTVLTEAYENQNEHYFPALQKFGVERTSTKTFHFSRMVELEAAVEKMQRLGFAKPDHSGSWCMSTPKMVQIFVTCATVEYQKRLQLPRCSDHPVHDELAAVIECLPQSGEAPKPVTRAILEFPYPVPKQIEHLPAEELQRLRDELLPQSSQFSPSILKITAALEAAVTKEKMKAILEYEIIPVHELYCSIQALLQSKGYEVEEWRGQYRWYVPRDSILSALTETKPVRANQATLSAVEQTASTRQAEGLTQYPGCFIWTLEAPNKQSGLLKRIKRLWG